MEQITALPPRHIKTPSRSITGLYPFQVPGIESRVEYVTFESSLERDFLMKLELIRSVIDITSQPLTLEYQNDNGVTYPYTPDYLVTFRVGSIYPEFIPSLLVEVKPRKLLQKSFNQWKSKYRKAVSFCKQEGYTFRLMDEGRIRDQYWLNALFLRRYRKLKVDRDIEDLIVQNLELMGCTTFETLVKRNFRCDLIMDHGKACIWKLLADHKISCDFSLPLGWNTEMWLPQW